jgi:uncharacterized repeat protein (TIGR02543 family)
MILLPDREYTMEQLVGILQHELTHLRRFDVLVKWLSNIACILHWFNPLVWLARREINRTCELACDAAVIRKMKEEEKMAYGHTLISLVTGHSPTRLVLAAAMFEKADTLKERLLFIRNYEPHKMITTVCSAAVIASAVFVVCVCGASTSSFNQNAYAAASLNSGIHNDLNAAINTEDTENKSESDVSENAQNLQQKYDNEDQADADTKIIFTVTYDGRTNGGTTHRVTRNIVNGDVADLSLQAQKEGWTFNGWNIDPNAVDGLPSYTPNSHATLYAVFSKTLTATLYNTNGQSRFTQTRDVTIYNNAKSGTVTLPAITSVYSDWSGRGWTASTAPNGVLNAGAASQEYHLNSDITLYATLQQFVTITYDANGGTPTPVSETIIRYSSGSGQWLYPSSYMPGAISRQGYSFAGWKADTSGTVYQPGASIQTGNTNRTFTAQWN